MKNFVRPSTSPAGLEDKAAAVGSTAVAGAATEWFREGCSDIAEDDEDDDEEDEDDEDDVDEEDEEESESESDDESSEEDDEDDDDEEADDDEEDDDEEDDDDDWSLLSESERVSTPFDFGLSQFTGPTATVISFFLAFSLDFFGLDNACGVKAFALSSFGFALFLDIGVSDSVRLSSSVHMEQLQAPFGILFTGGSQHDKWNPLSQVSQNRKFSVGTFWRQYMQVLHSMHCHFTLLILAVNSGVYFRQDGWALVPQSEQVNNCSQTPSRFFSELPEQ